LLGYIHFTFVTLAVKSITKLAGMTCSGSPGLVENFPVGRDVGLWVGTELVAAGRPDDSAADGFDCLGSPELAEDLPVGLDVGLWIGTELVAAGRPDDSAADGSGCPTGSLFVSYLQINTEISLSLFACRITVQVEDWGTFYDNLT
jgi:hypothetical protein